MYDREFSDTTGAEVTEQREFCKITGLKMPDFNKGEEESSFVCRIMPAFGSCRDTNKRMVYHSVHYGYKGPNKRNPDKLSVKPFFCIEKIDFDTKRVLVSCPECELIASRNETLDRMKTECKMKEMTTEETHKVCEPVYNWLKEHRADRKWYLNVLGIDGKFYTLKVNNTLKRDVLVPLLDKITNVRKIDPFAFDQGVWLNFTRRGTHTDNVSIVMETVTKDGDTFEKPKKAPLSPDIKERAKKILNDLKHDLFPTLTYDQIKQLTVCSGDPDEVDAVFNIPTDSTVKVVAPTPTQSIAPVMTKKKVDAIFGGETTKTQVKIQNIVSNPVPVEDPSDAFYNKLK